MELERMLCLEASSTTFDKSSEGASLSQLAKVRTKIDAITIQFKIIKIDRHFVDQFFEFYLAPGEHTLQFDVSSASIIGATGMSYYSEDLRKLKFGIEIEAGEEYIVHLSSVDNEEYHAKIGFYNAKDEIKFSLSSYYPEDKIIKEVYIGEK